MLITGEKLRRQIDEWVMPRLEGGEAVRVIVPWVQTGPRLLAITGNMALSRYKLWPLVFRVRYYTLVLSDRRVLLVRRSRATARPEAIEWSAPVASAVVPTYARTRRSRVIELATNAGSLKLVVKQQFFSDSDAFVAALRAA